MTAREILVPIGEKPALKALMRDYMEEMAEFVGVTFREYPRFDLYWTEPDVRWPFWIQVGNENAGFALIRRDADAERTEMAEFFITRRCRHRGIGVAAARRLIGRHPGPWHITQRENNVAAIAFWHRVLDGFVRYDEATTAADAVRREQRFTIG